jgi:hypothetical protein
MMCLQFSTLFDINMLLSNKTNGPKTDPMGEAASTT